MITKSAMKTLGFVNMFNRGVRPVQTDLKENGNQPAEFSVNLITAFKVDVKVSQRYTNKTGGTETHVGERNRKHETERLYLSSRLPSFW